MSDHDLSVSSPADIRHQVDIEMSAFLNRVRSLFNIDWYLLPELDAESWKQFRDDPPRYVINRADLPQLRAIWREVEKRQ